MLERPHASVTKWLNTMVDQEVLAIPPVAERYIERSIFRSIETFDMIYARYDIRSM